MKWVQKLTSRKLWVAVAAFVSGLIIAFKGDAVEGGYAVPLDVARGPVL